VRFLSVVRGVKALVSFFTVFPIRGDGDLLGEAASYMPLAPLIGLAIGFLAGLVYWLLFQVFPNLVVGFLTLGFLLLVTGLHHTDGLLDFGDGLICRGSPERKVEAMRDLRMGTGGLALGLVTLAATAAAIAYFEIGVVVQGLIVAEVSAKLGMVVIAWVGRAASQGLGSRFIEAMHGPHRHLRLLAPVALSTLVSAPLLGLVGVLALAAGSITALGVVWVSNRQFGGLTGDVLGAANDLSRLASLLALLAVC